MRLLGLFGLAVLALGRAASPEAGGFESLGVPVRVGGLMGCIVGPDGRGGEALYFNFNQTAGRLFLVQVNPDTGEARQYDTPQGPGAWAFIAGPDEKVYLGTWDGGLILRFDPRQPERQIEVVGKPSLTESYLWQYDAGPDGRLYASTYPQARLVSYDPRSGAMEDHGRMHPTEMYARSVVAASNGKVYVGVGTARGDLVVFDPATKRQKSLLPPESVSDGGGTVTVSRRADGQVYAEFGPHVWRIDDETLTPVKSAPGRALPRLRDGREVTAFGRGTFTLRDPRTGATVERSFKYAGSGDLIFVVGNGPGGAIYGSTALPMEVFRYEPETGKSVHLGGMPGGEVYSLLERAGKLYLCFYGGAVMNLYDPRRPEWKYGTSPESNPVSFGGVGDGHLRPRAMIDGPDGMIYVGSEPPYGQHGGAMAVWDPRVNRTIENYRHLIPNQSIVSLAWEPKSGLIFGGSGNWGGGGTRPAEKEAKFFAFDPKRKTKVFESALVAGARSYPATVAAEGRIYTTAGDKLLVFDPATMAVVRTVTLPGKQVEISLGRHASGRLVGLTGEGVYVYDPAREEITVRENAPVKVRCGFALTEDAVYFGSGVTLWRYRLPATARGGRAGRLPELEQR